MYLQTLHSNTFYNTLCMISMLRMLCICGFTADQLIGAGNQSTDAVQVRCSADVASVNYRSLPLSAMTGESEAQDSLFVLSTNPHFVFIKVLLSTANLLVDNSFPPISGDKAAVIAARSHPQAEVRDLVMGVNLTCKMQCELHAAIAVGI